MNLYVIGVLVTESNFGLSKIGYKLLDIDSKKTVYASTDSVATQLKSGLNIIGLSYNAGSIGELDRYPELLYKDVRGKGSDTLIDNQRNHIIVLERCMNNMISVCNVSGSMGKVDVGYIISMHEKGCGIYNASVDNIHGLCIYDYIPGDLDYQNSEDVKRKHLMYKMFGTSGMHFRLIENSGSEICIEKEDGDDYSGVLDIPSGVTGISLGGFMGSKITEVIIPSSIQYIGKCAFLNASKLKKLTMVSGGESPIFIPERMCAGCKSLTSVTLSSNVRGIGRDAFKNSGLKKIVIPMVARQNMDRMAIPRGVAIQWI